MSKTAIVQVLKSALTGVNVYHNPPENFKMGYPCIIISLDGQNINHANDKKYIKRNRWILLCIDKVVSDEVKEVIESFSYSSFVRMYMSDNLEHYIYELYY